MESREWEMYEDFSYFNMWAVREISNRNFNSPTLFHFVKKQNAEKFLMLLTDQFLISLKESK